MTIDSIKTVCFIGSGTMGCANAMVSALAGYDVVLFDISRDSLKAVPSRLREIGAYIVSVGLASDADIDAVIDRLIYTDDLSLATRYADLVSESVIEDINVKRTVHAQLDAICSPSTILTTNTSALLLSDIAPAVSQQRGERFAALHSHLGSKLVDIVPCEHTDPEIIETLKNYVISLGAVPLILQKENPGYVMNAMLGPLLTSAMLILANDIATIETVDRVWMKNRDSSIGPFGLMDLFGIDVVLSSWKNPKDTEDYRKHAGTILDLLQPYVTDGHLGMKAGSGFYTYPQPSYQSPDREALLDSADTDLCQILLVCTWISSALILAARRVTDADTINEAWCVSMESTSGPFDCLEALTIDTFIEQVETCLASGWLSSEAWAIVLPYLQNQFESDRRISGGGYK